MTMQQVSPPAALAVSMDAAREALRRDDDAMDLSIGIALNALIAEAEHITRRKFINRAMRVSLPAFPDAIRLAAPTFAVASVQYVDALGQTQTLDPASYYVDQVTCPGYIVPAEAKQYILACLQLQFDPTSKVTKTDLVKLLDGLRVYG